ncbi:alpha/beta hydrolase [Corynebacterium kroppenstedtii]|nr:alpha/beta hydrolase [Corynebacterium pseudokroppenstedtii]MDK7146639.1 alpha/beta hydrolase [Corynebacterium pseudokroppenstedtii]MDU6478309.1 alpha/beta hydrolase [Corynebacterium kroppenstedtii]QRP14345.1 alpha/beta hydrolase [Corynebacterium kroppenstedtii]
MQTDVKFSSGNQTIAGTLFIPDEAQGASPAIVISHPFGSVRQQSPINYATRLTKEGFVTLTFDAAYQGESTGEPRQLEDPFIRVENIKDAVSYLATREEVDADRIGALGICASGGFVPFAASSDIRIKAVATVSGADLGDVYRSQTETLPKLLKASAQARTDRAAGKDVEAQPMIPMTQDQANEYPDRSMYKEAYDYYRTDRAKDDRAPNTVDPTSFDRIAVFDAYGFIDQISPRPLLMIAGSDADTLPYSQNSIEKAQEPKELFIVDGASHVDLYDKPEYVDPAVAKMSSFFHENLATN